MRGARILLVWAAVGCGSSAKPEPAEPTDPVVTPNPSDRPPDTTISLVTSMVVIDACPESRTIDTKRANREIEELVGPCKKVPGGSAHFSATLMPGGQVELGSPSGDRADGVVPTCVMQQSKQLKHKLRLSKACKFDVKLEQRVAEQQP